MPLKTFTISPILDSAVLQLQGINLSERITGLPRQVQQERRQNHSSREPGLMGRNPTLVARACGHKEEYLEQGNCDRLCVWFVFKEMVWDRSPPTIPLLQKIQNREASALSTHFTVQPWLLLVHRKKL